MTLQNKTNLLQLLACSLMYSGYSKHSVMDIIPGAPKEFS